MRGIGDGWFCFWPIERYYILDPRRIRKEWPILARDWKSIFPGSRRWSISASLNESWEQRMKLVQHFLFVWVMHTLTRMPWWLHSAEFGYLSEPVGSCKTMNDLFLIVIEFMLVARTAGIFAWLAFSPWACRVVEISWGRGDEAFWYRPNPRRLKYHIIPTLVELLGS